MMPRRTALPGTVRAPTGRAAASPLGSRRVARFEPYLPTVAFARRPRQTYYYYRMVWPGILFPTRTVNHNASGFANELESSLRHRGAQLKTPQYDAAPSRPRPESLSVTSRCELDCPSLPAVSTDSESGRRSLSPNFSTSYALLGLRLRAAGFTRLAGIWRGPWLPSQA